MATPPLFSHPIITPSLPHDLVGKKTNFNGEGSTGGDTNILFQYIGENQVKIRDMY